MDGILDRPALTGLSVAMPAVSCYIGLSENRGTLFGDPLEGILLYLGPKRGEIAACEADPGRLARAGHRPLGLLVAPLGCSVWPREPQAISNVPGIGVFFDMGLFPEGSLCTTARAFSSWLAELCLAAWPKDTPFSWPWSSTTRRLLGKVSIVCPQSPGTSCADLGSPVFFWKPRDMSLREHWGHVGGYSMDLVYGIQVQATLVCGCCEFVAGILHLLGNSPSILRRCDLVRGASALKRIGPAIPVATPTNSRHKWQSKSYHKSSYHRSRGDVVLLHVALCFVTTVRLVRLAWRWGWSPKSLKPYTYTKLQSCTVCIGTLLQLLPCMLRTGVHTSVNRVQTCADMSRPSRQRTLRKCPT